MNEKNDCKVTKLKTTLTTVSKQMNSLYIMKTAIGRVSIARGESFIF